MHVFGRWEELKIKNEEISRKWIKNQQPTNHRITQLQRFNFVDLVSPLGLSALRLRWKPRPFPTGDYAAFGAPRKKELKNDIFNI